MEGNIRKEAKGGSNYILHPSVSQTEPAYCTVEVTFRPTTEHRAWTVDTPVMQALIRTVLLDTPYVQLCLTSTSPQKAFEHCKFREKREGINGASGWLAASKSCRPPHHCPRRQPCPSYKALCEAGNPTLLVGSCQEQTRSKKPLSAIPPSSNDFFHDGQFSKFEKLGTSQSIVGT